jgi:SnoaL-like polyketide cyclase
MSAEENKNLVRREQEELWNHTGYLDAAEEHFAAGQAEAAKQEAADFRQGFPDVVSTIEDLITEGDKVVARWRSRATHQGVHGHSPDWQRSGIHGHLLLPNRGRQDRRIMEQRGPVGLDATDRRHFRAGTIRRSQSYLATSSFRLTLPPRGPDQRPHQPERGRSSGIIRKSRRRRIPRYIDRFPPGLGSCSPNRYRYHCDCVGAESVGEWATVVRLTPTRPTPSPHAREGAERWVLRRLGRQGTSRVSVQIC